MGEPAIDQDQEPIEKWNLPIIGPHGAKALSTSEIERIHEAAKNEGYERGYQEGLERAKAEITQKFGQIDELFLKLHMPVNMITQKAEQLCIMVIKLICKKIIQTEISMKEEIIQKLFRESLSCLPSSEESMIVYLNPADEIIFKNILAHEFVELKHVKVIPDDSIVSGGCRIKTSYSTIDATIDTRINDLFERHFKNATPAST